MPILNTFQKHTSTFLNNEFKNNIPTILYLGRIIPSKGVHYLIKAFARVERKGLNVFLIIAGTGPYQSKLENLAKKENIKNILFTRRYATNLDKITLYKACDIFVLPSVYFSYPEGWGLVLNEAMSFGKPVIATNMVGGVYDLIKHGINGFIVPQKNVAVLEETLTKLILDEKLRKIMGSNSKLIIQKQYKWSDMVKGFGNAIDYVLHSQPKNVIKNY
jgi:glycosyltransferase involved in cell wall biosynthesis